jgi:hypothetical protein
MLQKVIEWLGTALLISGAILSSLDIYPYNVFAFNIGSVLWLIAAIRNKHLSLIVVNGGLVAIYLFGVIRSFF